MTLSLSLDDSQFNSKGIPPVGPFQNGEQKQTRGLQMDGWMEGREGRKEGRKREGGKLGKKVRGEGREVRRKSESGLEVTLSTHNQEANLSAEYNSALVTGKASGP
ncbi:hypothetical protein L345_11951, partial [Ophiophagus hannah]